MIFSENRYPLFGIMLEGGVGHATSRPRFAATGRYRSGIVRKRRSFMRLHLWIRVACLALGLLAAGSAGAQSPAPSPEAMTAARELIVTMRAAEYFKTIMPALMRNLKPAIVQNRPQVERDYDALVPLLLEGMDA